MPTAGEPNPGWAIISVPGSRKPYTLPAASHSQPARSSATGAARCPCRCSRPSPPTPCYRRVTVLLGPESLLARKLFPCNMPQRLADLETCSTRRSLRSRTYPCSDHHRIRADLKHVPDPAEVPEDRPRQAKVDESPHAHQACRVYAFDGQRRDRDNPATSFAPARSQRCPPAFSSVTVGARHQQNAAPPVHDAGLWPGWN